MALIASLVTRLSLESSSFSSGLGRMRRETATTAASIKKSLLGISGTVGAFTTGLIAGATTGLVIATKRALEYASSLGEVAQQLGVTTKELQIFRFAMQQNGATAQEADSFLGKFSLNISKALEGAKGTRKAFLELGVSLEDLKNKSKTDLIKQIADHMVATGGASRNAAAGMLVFGKGFQKAIPLLDQGAKGFSAVEQAAEKLGIVLEDQFIDQADEAADKMDALKTVLEANIANAVAQNANSIVGLANSLTDLTVAIVKFLNSNPQTAFAIIGAFIGGRFGLPGAGVGAVGGFLLGDRISQNQRDQSMDLGVRREEFKKAQAEFRRQRESGADVGGIGSIIRLKDAGKPASGPGLQKAREEFLRQQRLYVAAQRAALAPKGTSITPGAEGNEFLSRPGKGGGGGKKDDSAEKAKRAREEALRREFEIASELRDAKIAELEATQEASKSIEEKANIELQILDLNREEERQRLALDVALGDRTEAEAEAVNKIRDNVLSMEKEKVLADKRAALAEEQLQKARSRTDLEVEILGLQANLADNNRERMAIELRILDLVTEQERLELESIKASNAINSAKWQEADARLRALDQIKALKAEDVRRSNAGPLEQFQKQFSDISDELEELKVEGIEGAINALSQLTDGWKSMKDAAISAIKDILAELLRLNLRRLVASFLPQLGNGLFSFASKSPSAGPPIFTPSNPGVGYSSGGYTGDYSASAITGFVHGQEGVLNQRAMRMIGIPMLNALNRGIPLGALVSNDNWSRGGGGNRFLTQNYYITTPNPDGFHRSERQIKQRGRRGLGVLV